MFSLYNDASFQWPWNPGVGAFVVLLCVVYGLGLLRVRGRRETQDAPLRGRHIMAFAAAIVLMALVLLTPFDYVARTQRFSFHIAQLVILTTFCAPLLLYGVPPVLARPLVELPVIRQIVYAMTRPLVASILFNSVFLLWHAPRIFNTAMHNAALYHIAVISIFCLALCNWYPLIGSLHELRRMSYPLQMVYAFFDGQPVNIFAFVLVFSEVSLYPGYPVPHAAHFLPFSDQAVGGVLLLIPGLADLVVMSPLFMRWLNQIEQRTRLADQRRVADESEEWEDADEEWEEDENVEEAPRTPEHMPGKRGQQLPGSSSAG